MKATDQTKRDLLDSMVWRAQEKLWVAAEERWALEAKKHMDALDALRPSLWRRILIYLGLIRHKNKPLFKSEEDPVLVCRYKCDSSASLRKLDYSKKNPFSL